MTRTRHQPAVAQPVQQRVDAAELVDDAKVLLDDLLHVDRTQRAAGVVVAVTIVVTARARVWHPRIVQTLAHPLLLIGREVAMVAAGVARPTPVLQGFDAAPVVIVHPLLNGPPTLAQRPRDVRGRASLLGQDDRLQLHPRAGVAFALLLGQLLNLFQRVSLRDVHGQSSVMQCRPPDPLQYAITQAPARGVKVDCV